MKKNTYYVVTGTEKSDGCSVYRLTQREQVQGYTFSIDGVEFGITKGYKGYWGITHLETGMFIGSRKRKQDVESFVEKHIDLLKTKLENTHIGDGVTMCKNVINLGWKIYQVKTGENSWCDIGITNTWNNDTNEYKYVESLFTKNAEVSA